MFDKAFTLLYQIITFVAFISILSFVGGLISQYLPFFLFVEFFAFLRYLLIIPDTFFHVPTLLTLLGTSFIMLGGFYLIKGFIFLSRWLRLR